MRAFRSKEFKNWYLSLTAKDKRIVDSRVDVLRTKGILVKSKLLDSKSSLYEFKWNSGMRVYYSLLKDSDGNFILLLIGGNKNSQSKDITNAKKIIEKAIGSIKCKQKK